MGPSGAPARRHARSLEDLDLTRGPAKRARLPLALATALALLSAPMAARASAAESVTLSSSRTSMTFGQTARFAGRIEAAAGCVGGRQVKLAWRADAADPWAVVAISSTAPDGTFAFTNGQDYTGRFRAQLPATASCTFAASDGIAVKVHALVDMAVVAGSLEAGSCVDVEVGVSPVKTGQEVQLQRRVAGAWSAIDTLTLDGTSSAHAAPCFGWEDLGVVRLRVRWPVQDALNAAGISSTLAFKIERSAWMTAIDDAIGRHAVSVAVAADGDAMYEHADGAVRIPASNEKLLLSMALLDRLGPQHRIPTIAAASHVRNGVVRGDLWILGRGDPEVGPARLGALADQLGDAGIERVRGRVMGATTYFRHDWWARGWKRHITRRYVALPSALTFHHNVVGGREIRDPERRAAASLTTQLERLGIRVKGRPGAGAPPPGAAPIAEIRSRPLLSLLAAMDRPSDNYYAEVLGKALGAARSGPPGTIVKAANAIEAFTDAHGADFTLFDSSGLSYDNRVTAGGILRLLTFANDAAWGNELRHALPTGGQGTLEDRLHDVKVRAKTGTLDGVSALSGWVWVRHEDRWVEFSILSAGMSKAAAVRIEDKVVHVLSNKATSA